MVAKSEVFLTWTSLGDAGGRGIPPPISQPHGGPRAHSSLTTGLHRDPADSNLLPVYLINSHEEMRMCMNFHPGPELHQLFILYNPHESLPFIKS